MPSGTTLVVLHMVVFQTMVLCGSLSDIEHRSVTLGLVGVNSLLTNWDFQ